MGRFPLLLIVAGLCLCGFAAVQVAGVPNLLEYAAVAPTVMHQGGYRPEEAKPSEDGEGEDAAPGQGGQDAQESPLKPMLEAFSEFEPDISEVAQGHALEGYASQVSVGDGGEQSQTAELRALGPGHHQLYPVLMNGGRRFSEEELVYGDKVALIDEGLAIALYRVSLPIDRELVVGGVRYTVAGVVKHTRRVGDPGAYSVYLPLRSLAKYDNQSLDTLTLAVLPKPGAGARKTVEGLAKQWNGKGRLVDLRREKARALLVPRWLSGFLGIAIVVMLMRATGAYLVRRVKEFQRELRTRYFVRMLPRVLRVGLSVILAYTALLAAIYLLASFVISPVLLFPEWVPAVPVEVSDIRAAFWESQLIESGALTVRTPHVVRIAYYASLARTGVVLLLTGGLLAFARGARRRLLPGLYRTDGDS